MQLGLASGPIPHAGADGLGVNLAGQVDAQGVVHGVVVVVGGDGADIHDIFGVVELDERVVVGPLNLPGAGAVDAGAYQLVPMNRLATPVDDAFAHEVEDAGGCHFGVPAQVFL